MSNSLDSFLTRIGDVTIERVTPRSSPRSSDQGGGSERPGENISASNPEIHARNDEDSDGTGGETSDGELEKKMETLQADEMHSEGSGDDMDLDETIDTEIGVRMDPIDRQRSDSSGPDDDDGVNILDTLPLEGAPIEGQEVSEADLLGKPLCKDDDGESMDESAQLECNSNDEDDPDGCKRRAEDDESDSVKKKQKKEDSNEEGETKSEKKLANMRRNIREVMDETQLDEATLSAQRQEMERLRRVQEQQRIIREVQRQIAINRQNNKTQTRVISLLQGKQNDIGTTLSQTSPSSSSQVKMPSTVMLKVNNASQGAQSPSSGHLQQPPRRPIEGMRWQKGRGGYPPVQTSISRLPGRPPLNQNVLQQRIRMMTPSVSISPVVPKKEPSDRLEYDTDSDISEAEHEEIIDDNDLHKIPSLMKLPKPPKGKDVVTISSSSDDSDDDCIVLSDPSGGEETDTEDDPANSGMHTNDRYNIPDEHGRVLVNVGHPDGEPDVYLAPQISRIIKPHQIGGIRFLFDNIVESIDRYKSSSGFGCILAHSMGLGKTLQVASFCDIFFRCTTAKTVLCIMPINTLQNWLAEFNMWLPYEDPDSVKPETSSSSSSSSLSQKNGNVIDPKTEIKEENSNLTDVSSSMSSSTESANRSGQDISTGLPGMMAGNPFSQQTYDNQGIPYNYQENMMKSNMGQNPNFNQRYLGNIPHNQMYGHGYPQMKQEMDLTEMSKNLPGPLGYGNEGQPPQNSGNLYGSSDNRQGQIYPSSENHGSMYPPMGNQSTQGNYQSYQQIPPVQPYQNYPPTIPQQLQRSEDSRNASFNIKKEPEEFSTKDEGTSTGKEESSDEKKDATKVKTPYCVDAPIGVEIRPRHFKLHILNDSHKTMAARARVIKEWQKNGGVLLIGYELYRQLSLKKPNKAKRKRGQAFNKDTVDVEEEDKNKGFLDEMHGALVNPGPDLVICDEGHRIKNSHASISLALKQMRTKRRIVLTGYPLQNNLLEYWCMVDFVRPNYLGTKSEFCNMFERPIQNGQCIDSTPQDIRLMRYRAHVLHALLEGFVQRRSHSVLQISLPRKEEYILLVRMTPHQRKLYDTFMNQVVKTRAVPNPLKAFAVCCKIWNHPDILYHFLKKRQTNEEDDLDLEETIAEKSAPGSKRGKAKTTKGETKKGRKVNATVKNKPAASIPPNSSISVSNGDGDSENAPENKPGNFGNHPQLQNSNFSGANANNYQQNFGEFRGNDQQGNYYRNDSNSGEFSEFYGVQGGQRYSNQPGSFQNFPQGSSNYGNSSQNFSQQNQNQVYQGNDGNSDNSQKYSQVNSGNTEFPNDQSSSNNYEVPEMFPRQQYGFQDQSRNYPPNVNQRVNQQYQQNMNQQTNYPSQISNQTTAPMAEYSGYNEQQTNQNYSSTSARSSQIYSQNQTNSQGNPQSSGYSANQASHPPSSQQNSSAMLPSSYPQSQQNQNQSHSYQNQMTSNDSGSSIPTNQQLYPNNQPNQDPMAQNGSQTYMGNQQNPMGNYTSSQNQNLTPQNQNMRSQGPGNYQNNQTTPGITIKQEYPGSHLLPGGGQDSSYPPPQNTNTGAQNYQQNSQVSIVQGQNQAHRYPGTPQGQANLPNQGVNYPPGQQGQNDQQNRGQAMTNYSGDSSWQGNYSQQIPSDQATDQYYREQNPNRYQNSYFPGQNYQQNSYSNDFSTGTETNNKTEDAKPTHPGMLPRNQNPQVQFDKKDAGIGIQNQQIPAGQNYSNPNDSNIPNISNAPNISNQPRQHQNMPACLGFNNRVNQTDPNYKEQQDLEKKNKEEILPEKEKDDKSDDEVLVKEEEKDCKNSPGGKEDPGIPYDWATDLMKGYVPGIIDASAKMSMFFCILEEAIKLGDRVLTFSQSLFTLNLIEDFLARNDFKYRDGQTESWVKNINYYRLDGSTSALEREKLINEFNHNPKIHLFLVSTRAGSLGINLVGANRAIVFDASWNPCHDTQAVCRVYRYGQQKPCYVYRLVTDNCLERKIYDRQISKQGMADRVVDQCNPDAHLSLKEATTLSWDWEEDSQVQDFSATKDTYTDEVMHSLLEKYSSMLTKQPFHHESLLVDRKDKKLSQAEKRLARRGYELEKMAATSSRPSYNYIPGNTATRAGGLQIRAIRGGDQGVAPKPVASVRPMQQRGAEGLNARGIVGSRWIPAEVWQRQGMSAQEMTLPLDVVIPTNSPDKSSIVLKAGQRVMVLKSPKGIYMQLESGKIIAIRTALKLNQQKREEEPKKGSTSISPRTQNPKPDVGFPLRNNSAISIIPKVATNTVPTPRPLSRPSSGSGYRQFTDKDVGKRPKPVIPSPILKPMGNQMNLSGQVSLQKIFKGKLDSVDHSSAGENSNSSDSQPRTDQRVEEVRLEDVVAEASSHPEYSPSNSRVLNPDSDSNSRRVDDDNKERDFNMDQLSGGKIVGQSIQHNELDHPEKHRLMSSQMKDEIRSVQAGTYSHVESYGHPAPPPKVNTDEIVLEEPSSQSSMSMQHPSPMIPQHQNMQQDVSRSRSLTTNQTHTQLSQEMPKSHPESSNSRASSISSGVLIGTNPPLVKERSLEIQEMNPSDPHSLPQGYPYTQYPRYYDYADPRSRNLTSPYGSYYPSGQPSSQRQQEGHKEVQRQPVDIPKATEERITMPTAPAAYHQGPQVSVPPPAAAQQPSGPPLETNEQKNSEQSEQPAQPSVPTANRTDTQAPTAFSHPPSSRYPATYPSTYDPYSQHYPATPGSPASYPPSGTPGYAGYGGPGYNTEYARMYSAFHGPPPVADPYMHRGYAPPPSSHPSNYYAPFPHPPPPPYPNYSFLPTYSNPNIPSESQPPAQ